jgi:hypothetical protein
MEPIRFESLVKGIQRTMTDSCSIYLQHYSSGIKVELDSPYPGESRIFTMDDAAIATTFH